MDGTAKQYNPFGVEFIHDRLRDMFEKLSLCQQKFPSIGFTTSNSIGIWKNVLATSPVLFRQFSERRFCWGFEFFLSIAFYTRRDDISFGGFAASY